MRNYNQILTDLESLAAEINEKAGNDVRKEFYTKSAKEVIGAFLTAGSKIEAICKETRRAISRNGLLYY